MEPIRWHTFRRRTPLAASADAARRFADVTGQGNQFGIGASARSRLDQTVYRNHSRYDAYLERVLTGQSPVDEAKSLDPTEQRLRHIAMTLGDGQPLCHSAYLRQFSSDFSDDFGEAAGNLAAAGLIASTKDATVLTETGQQVYDLVTRAFYPNPVRRWLDERQQLAQRAANLRPRRSAAVF